MVLTRGRDRPPEAVGPRPGASLCFDPQPGWRSRILRPHNSLPAPALLLTNFAFGRSKYLYGHTDPLLRWPRGGILISVIDYSGASWPRGFKTLRPTSPPLRVRRRDFAAFEGVAELGRRDVALGDRPLELWVQARPTTAATIAAANRALARVSVCG